MNKKQDQLGINPSTASHRLTKDILWNLIVRLNLDTCCKCGCKMTRETFSIEHKQPWLDSEDPVALYFDLNNIGFSHLRCNVSDRRITNKNQDRELYKLEKRKSDTEYRRKRYSPEVRKAKYNRTGQ